MLKSRFVIGPFPTASLRCSCGWRSRTGFVGRRSRGGHHWRLQTSFRTVSANCLILQLSRRADAGRSARRRPRCRAGSRPRYRIRCRPRNTVRIRPPTAAACRRDAAAVSIVELAQRLGCTGAGDKDAAVARARRRSAGSADEPGPGWMRWAAHPVRAPTSDALSSRPVTFACAWPCRRSSPPPPP